MKKIPSEFLFGQLLDSTSLGCPFTFLWEAFLSIIGQSAPFQVIYCPIASSQKYFLDLVEQFL